MTETIYLAGPIQHVNDYGKGWREWLKNNRDDYDWLDPMDKYDTMKEAEDEWTEVDIVEDDLLMIDDSAALLVHWDAVPTCGTPMEIFYSYHDAQIPVVVQTTLHESDLSPWLIYHASAIVDTFDDAIDALDRLLQQDTLANA